MPAADLLNLVAVDGMPGVFALGRIDDRLSIASQQVRALNVAYGLGETLDEMTHVVVIGGGIGGLTAALGLLRLGARVTVLEKHRVLHLMEDASHRFIHPNTLDWPSLGSLDDAADLPVLDWVASDGATLTARWRREAKVYKDYFGDRFRVLEGCAHTQVASGADGIVISFNSTDDVNGHLEPNLCIFCVGYGTDRPPHGFHHLCGGYWVPDTLERPDDTARDILVSGTGDAGLTDLFRACFVEFSLSEMLSEVVEPHLSDLQLRSIMEVEDALARGEVDAMRGFYESLYVPAIVEALAGQLRHDRQVTLNGVAPSMFSPGACAANRVLLSQLRHVRGAPRYRQGKVARNPKLKRERVNVEIDRQSLDFDKVVVRHGPLGVLDREYPPIARAVERTALGLRRAHPEIDPLRRPQWPRGFFTSTALAGLDRRVRQTATRLELAGRAS
jgi:hypothetical protein